MANTRLTLGESSQDNPDALLQQNIIYEIELAALHINFEKKGEETLAIKDDKLIEQAFIELYLALMNYLVYQEIAGSSQALDGSSLIEKKSPALPAYHYLVKKLFLEAQWKAASKLKLEDLLPLLSLTLQETLFEKVILASGNGYLAEVLVREASLKPEQLKLAKEILNNPRNNTRLIEALSVHPSAGCYLADSLASALQTQNESQISKLLSFDSLNDYLARLLTQALMKQEHIHPEHLTLAKAVLHDPKYNEHLISVLSSSSSEQSLQRQQLKDKIHYEDNEQYVTRIEALLNPKAEIKPSPEEEKKACEHLRNARLLFYQKNKPLKPVETQEVRENNNPQNNVSSTAQTASRPPEAKEDPLAKLSPEEQIKARQIKFKTIDENLKEIKTFIKQIMNKYRKSWFISADRRTNVDELIKTINSAENSETIAQNLAQARGLAKTSDEIANSHTCCFFFKRNYLTGGRYNKALDQAVEQLNKIDPRVHTI